jgi:urea transport system substrate-binding protein
MQERRRGDLPNLWVVLPVLGACLVAVLATMVSGSTLGLLAGAVTGLMAAIAVERPQRALAAVVAKIAGGDRYAIVPEQPKGPQKRFFLLGTDTVYPRTTNAILKSYLDAHGVTGDAVAEFYTPFNHKSWEDTVSWIHRFGEGGDAAIVTTVSGDANIYFYRELARQGITAESMPAMTLSIGEGEFPAISGPEMAGHLAAWSYLHAIDSPENRAFVAAWRKFCGAPNVVTDDPMEATWISFNLWKEAVTRAGAVDVDHVRRALSGLRVRARSGFEVFMDAANHHLHKPVVIGRITPAARIVPVWMAII